MIFVLFWESAALPQSSLAHMIADAVERHGSSDSRYFLDERGLDSPALAAIASMTSWSSPRMGPRTSPITPMAPGSMWSLNKTVTKPSPG